MSTLPSSVQPPPCSWRVEKKNTFLASFGGASRLLLFLVPW